MNSSEIILLVVMLAALGAGTLVGALAPPRWFGRLRLLVLAVLIGFLVTMIAGVITAQYGPDAPDLPKIIIFWIMVACTAACLFTFCAGVAGLFRRSVRRTAALIAALAVLPVPIFFGLAALSRWLR